MKIVKRDGYTINCTGTGSGLGFGRRDWDYDIEISAKGKETAKIFVVITNTVATLKDLDKNEPSETEVIDLVFPAFKDALSVIKKQGLKFPRLGPGDWRSHFSVSNNRFYAHTSDGKDHFLFFIHKAKTS